MRKSRPASKKDWKEFQEGISEIRRARLQKEKDEAYFVNARRWILNDCKSQDEAQSYWDFHKNDELLTPEYKEKIYEQLNSMFGIKKG